MLFSLLTNKEQKQSRRITGEKSTLLTVLLLIVHCQLLIAQVPQAFKYQAVARDSTGVLITNQSISIRAAIIANSTNGTVVYQETHSLMTNDYGLMTTNIGGGTPLVSTFASIDWSLGAHFMRIEMDETGGSNYALLSEAQMLSVPYALYAQNVGAIPDKIQDIDSNTAVSVKQTDDIIRFQTAGTERWLMEDNRMEPVNGTDIFIGQDAGGQTSSSSASVYVGHLAGANSTTAIRSTAIGHASLRSNTTGEQNVAVGFSALRRNIDGDTNTAVGAEALYENVSGYANTALGWGALRWANGGSNNTGIGTYALYNNDDGNENTAVGIRAGYTGGGSRNVYLGYRAGFYNTDNDRLYIDNSDTTAPLIYGQFDTDILGFNANVGIGNSSPGERLSVTGIVESEIGGFKFPDGTVQTTASTGDNLGDHSATQTISLLSLIHI